jgi:CDP-diacylglycerol pyrophosphatase
MRIGACVFELTGRRFVARKIDSPKLDGINLFRLLSTSGMMSEMLHQTMVVVGSTLSEKEEFIVLAEQADEKIQGSGHGEDLLDHDCS